MKMLILVAAGGAIGSMLRHLIGLAVRAQAGTAFPWATLAVNLAGCAVAGALAADAARGGWSNAAAGFVFAGLLGGFTTFSAFGLDTLELWRRGDLVAALAYVAASLVGGIGVACAAYAAAAR